jgi:hypothetical protein
MKTLKVISWVSYLTGALLVFLNYIGVVQSGLAWTGWGVGMLGWVLVSFGPRFLPQRGGRKTEGSLGGDPNVSSPQAKLPPSNES